MIIIPPNKYEQRTFYKTHIKNVDRHRHRHIHMHIHIHIQIHKENNTESDWSLPDVPMRILIQVS